MTAEYSFERKSVFLLGFAMLTLLILVYFLGLLTGMSVGGPEPTTTTQLKTVEKTEKQPVAAEVATTGGEQQKNSALSQETEPGPVTPEFKEVSPQAEQPKISQPKKE